MHPYPMKARSTLLLRTAGDLAGRHVRGRCRIALAGIAMGMSLSVAAPVLAMDTISATHAFPTTITYTQSFLEFVRKANEAGKGVFEIKVRGGPEAIPQMQQANAARDGVVDMVNLPCAFMAGTVPECDVVSAANVSAPTARANGGMDLLDKAMQKRMDAHLLGWFGSDLQFHLWSVREPKLDAQGALDVSGFKVRGNPLYNAFFTNFLKAQVINVNVPEVYTALERGTIEIMGWPEIGIQDANWNRFLKYRIDPGFFSVDVMVIVNKKKWDSLTPRTREILSKVSQEFEVESMKAMRALADTQDADLRKKGLQFVKQSPEAGRKFVQAAVDENLKRMKERMQKSGSVEGYDALVSRFITTK